MTTAELRDRFRLHDSDPSSLKDIRHTTYALAKLIDCTACDSREKSLALTKLEEAVMWADAAIARYGCPVSSKSGLSEWAELL